MILLWTSTQCLLKTFTLRMAIPPHTLVAMVEFCCFIKYVPIFISCKQLTMEIPASSSVKTTSTDGHEVSTAFSKIWLGIFNTLFIFLLYYCMMPQDSCNKSKRLICGICSKQLAKEIKAFTHLLHLRAKLQLIINFYLYGPLPTAVMNHQAWQSFPTHE